MPRTVVPKPKAGDELAAAAAAGPPPDGLPEKLVKYVPAETIAFFVFVSAAIGTGHKAWLIALTIIALLGTPAYLWVAAPTGAGEPTRYFYVLGTAAFACWALGTSGPLQSLIGISQTLGGVVLGTAAFLIPLADAALEKLKF